MVGHITDSPLERKCNKKFPNIPFCHNGKSYMVVHKIDDDPYFKEGYATIEARLSNKQLLLELEDMDELAIAWCKYRKLKLEGDDNEC